MRKFKLDNKKELLIEITNKCPLNCIYCSSNSNIRKNKFIDKNTIKKLIIDSKNIGIEKIQLSGGEPFQHPDIKKIIEFILEEGFELEVYTCGNLYINGNYQSIPERLLKPYNNKHNLTLRFNFQTINKKTSAYLTRSPFAFDNLLKTLKNCIKYNIRIGVHIIPTNLNIDQIEETIKFLFNELKITHIKILRLILHGRAKKYSNNLIFDEKKLYSTIFKLKHIFNDSKVEIGTAFSILSNSCEDCQAAKNKFMISTDLKLFPCTAFKNKTKCYIQIDEKNSLKKIISYKLINRKLQKFNENLECSYCRNKNDCFEICPIQKMICEKIIKFDMTKPIIESKAVY